MTNTDATKMAFFAVTDPKLITIDFAAHDKHATKIRAERDKANPPKPEPAQQELNKLRHQLFSLQEEMKNTEIYANDKACDVELLEQRLAEALKKKKAYAEAGNLLAERSGEHTVRLLESELVDAKRELTFAKKRSVNATRALRAFDGHGRIAELKAQIEKPLPVK